VERNQNSPVVVVGAGIVGCSIAVHLLDRGVRPVLIDADRPGQGASAESFASISAFGKDPAAYFQLAVAGVSGWSRFAGRLGGGVGLRRAGEVRVAGDPAEGRALARQVADARGRGYPVRPVGGAELRRLLPEARLGPVAAASFACRAELERAGARLLLGRPARVRLDDDGVLVEVGDERLRPRTTVLAAGAEAVQVGRLVAREVADDIADGLLAPFRPGRFAERTSRVMLEVESVSREPTRQDRST
jgi:glycine/D-amino acid oxidase-like deaminating enzyme